MPHLRHRTARLVVLVATAAVLALAATPMSVAAAGQDGTATHEICRYAGGRWEEFGVGTNFAVYHRWPGSGGWRSLGGRAYRGCEVNCFLRGWFIATGNDFRVCVEGTDQRLWRNDRRGATWSGWHRGC